jgi:hypothetical protein
VGRRLVIGAAVLGKSQTLMSRERQLSNQEFVDLSDSVIGDLTWIRDADLGHIDEGGLRELSARLRRLLVDGTLQRYRRAKGLKGEPRITSPALPPNIGNRVSFSQSGGVTRNGLTIAGIRTFNRALSPDKIDVFYKNSGGVPPQREQVISNWLSSPCMKIGSTSVTRRDVIKYVANKLGGVHLDSSRNSKSDLGYIALDTARNGVRIANLDSVYAELTAIGQHFSQSTEIESLL